MYTVCKMWMYSLYVYTYIRIAIYEYYEKCYYKETTNYICIYQWRAIKVLRGTR